MQSVGTMILASNVVAGLVALHYCRGSLRLEDELWTCRFDHREPIQRIRSSMGRARARWFNLGASVQVTGMVKLLSDRLVFRLSGD
jgi:hypothetical protein